MIPLSYDSTPMTNSGGISRILVICQVQPSTIFFSSRFIDMKSIECTSTTYSIFRRSCIMSSYPDFFHL